MWRPIRKWWLLKELRNESRRHGVEKLSLKELYFNNRHTISRPDFIDQTVGKSIERLSWVLRWRKKGNENKSKKRAQEYNSIFDELIRQHFIHVEPENEVKFGDIILNPKERPFVRTTDLGDEFISMFWWKIVIDNFYSRTIITGVVIGAVGLYLAHIFK